MAGDGQLALLVVSHQVVHASHVEFRVAFHGGEVVADAAAQRAGHHAADTIVEVGIDGRAVQRGEVRIEQALVVQLVEEGEAILHAVLHVTEFHGVAIVIEIGLRHAKRAQNEGGGVIAEDIARAGGKRIGRAALVAEGHERVVELGDGFRVFQAALFQPVGTDDGAGGSEQVFVGANEGKAVHIAIGRHGAAAIVLVAVDRRFIIRRVFVQQVVERQHNAVADGLGNAAGVGVPIEIDHVRQIARGEEQVHGGIVRRGDHFDVHAGGFHIGLHQRGVLQGIVLRGDLRLRDFGKRQGDAFRARDGIGRGGFFRQRRAAQAQQGEGEKQRKDAFRHGDKLLSRFCRCGSRSGRMILLYKSLAHMQ